MNKCLLWISILVSGFICAITASMVFSQSSITSDTTSEPNWNSPRTRELAKRACFDCHSNEVNLPWYSDLPIIGDIIQKDIEEGREALNFSEWGLREQEEASESAETVMDGSMPLPDYLLWHPEAKLSEAEKLELAEGLCISMGFQPNCGEVESEKEDHDDD